MREKGDLRKDAALAEEMSKEFTALACDMSNRLMKRGVDAKTSALVILNALTETMTRLIHIIAEMECGKAIEIDSLNLDIHKAMSEVLAKYTGRTTYCAELGKDEKSHE